MNGTVASPADRRSAPRNDPDLLPPDERDDMHLALRSIVEGTATATGTEFFYALVRELAQTLNVHHAFVCELLESKTRVRPLAFWFDGKFIDNTEFDLDGTPCEIVIRGETVYYTSKVYEMFPRNPELKELGIESYFGVPLVSESGNEMMGHLAVMHDQPMVKEFRGMALLRIFAARARAELERKRAEQALRKSEERLASILASAMDAIITLDAEQRITLFNPAAEKIFRCPATQAVGRPFEPFLSKRLGNLLKGYCLAVRPATVHSQQLWAPEGLTARRHDGEEFPVEATLSPLEIEGRRFFTVILRDVTERWQTEETLKHLQLEKVYLQEEAKIRQSPDHIVGDSPAMREVLVYAEQVAGTDSTVLLTGETGTGKSVIARTIHDLSARLDKMFVPVNCAALPGELVESELFGHEKGAFTGATCQRKGRFELADGGTLFLDEVGELTAGAQAQTVARVAGPGIRACGRQSDLESQRPVGRRHQSRLGEDGQGGNLSRRSVLPAERVSDPHAGPVRASDRYSAARAVFSGQVRAEDGQVGSRPVAKSVRAPVALSVARQYPGTAKRDRARDHPRPWSSAGNRRRARTPPGRSGNEHCPGPTDFVRGHGAVLYPQSAGTHAMGDRRRARRGGHFGSQSQHVALQDAEAEHPQS